LITFETSDPGSHAKEVGVKDPAEETFAARILPLLTTLGGTSQIVRPHRGNPKKYRIIGLVPAVLKCKVYENRTRFFAGTDFLIRAVRRSLV
jgi:hypothetical protein